MIIITIGEASRRLSSSAAVEESWVTHRMRTAAIDAEPPAVHVRVVAPAIALNLSAGGGVNAGRFERARTAAEERVIELWQQRGLHGNDFRSGQVIAFLHQLRDLLEQGCVTGRGRVPATRTAPAGLSRSAVPV